MKKIISYFLYPILLGVIFILFFVSKSQGWELKRTFVIMAGIRFLILFTLEFALPAKEEWKMTWRSFFRDLKYMMAAGLIMGIISMTSVWFAIDLSQFNKGILRNTSMWVELILVILTYEFFQYWYHRTSHEGRNKIALWLWKVHVAHHLPDKVYLLMHPAGHPFDFLFTLFIIQIPLVTLGARPEVVFFFNALMGLHGLVSHYNVEIKAGPLNYIFVGTELHRLHHSADPEEAKNYGVLTSFWDIVFGTFVLRSELPKRLGVFNPKLYPESNKFFKVTHCSKELEFLLSREDSTLKLDHLETLKHVRDSIFQRVTYTEAMQILEKAPKKFEYPVGFGKELQTEHERYLAEEHFKAPVIVTDYPKEFKAFYMKLNPDNKTVRAMDILVPGIGEIIGGSQREDNLELLLKRMHELKMQEEPLWWYLDLRKYGSVPHAGFGLGFERAIMYITGINNIRDVIPFPRTPKNCDF